MPIPSEVEKLKPRLARDEAYAKLREWIIEGTLGPGEQIRDTELASALGVSRMPVREALRRLEDEGLVESSANRWTRVAPLDMRQAEELYPIVRSLETLAVSLTGRRLKKDDLKTMEEANTWLERALEEGDAVGASRADDAFHQVFLERCGNTELIRIVAALKMKLRRLEIAYFGENTRADRSLADHREIVEAFETRDFEQAVEVLRRHWETMYDDE